MKTIVLLLITTLCFVKIEAQCTHNPTVFPTNLILCPNTTDTLWTQVYDSYQWYRGGAIIPGATQQYYVVSANIDAASYFSVEGTLNACAEVSPQILVDGYTFLGVTVITDGEFSDSMGVANACLGDTVLLIMNLPYTIKIQWTNNSVPIIGATNDTLIVTSTGNYSVSGAPSICPDYIQDLGLDIPVKFKNCSVGISENVQHSIINSYPNPFDHSILIELNTSVISKPDVLLVKDITGKIVERVTLTNSSTKISIGEQLTPGVYFIEYTGCNKPLRIVKVQSN